MIRKIVRMMAMVLVLSYFPVVMYFVGDAKASTVCTSVTTVVDNSGQNVLVTADGLSRIVLRAFPDLVGRRADSIDLAALERTIEQQPVVKQCDAYLTAGGVMHVIVSQREPIMRVFGSSGSYYMDAEAYRIKAGRDMKARTVVVNGNVGALLDSESLISLCKYIDASRFWKAQIEQVYVVSDSEYILVPRVGSHIILFGGTDNMEEKFANLKALYKYGWDKKEWNVYSKVNLKYKGQVICTKK